MGWCIGLCDTIGDMRYIASGFYYHVYQVSPTRVRKVPTSRMRKAWLLAVWRMTTSPGNWWKEVRNIDAWFSNELRMTRAFVATFPTPGLLGNPSEIADDGSYEQDYARSLGHMLRETNGSVHEFERYVRDYCRIQHEAWRCGFGERIWNFTFNCGVDVVTGQLVLIDLNELTEDKETMRAHIRNKHWRTQNSLAWLGRHYPTLVSVAERVLEEECTEERLEQEWGRFEKTRTTVEYIG